MGEFKLLGLAFSRRAMMISAISLFVTAVAACSSGASVTENSPGPDPNSSGENKGPSEAQSPGEVQPESEPVVAAESQSAGEAEVAEFDTDAYAKINPAPEIGLLNPEDQAAFYEDYRIPRDAIVPVYTPKFVSPDEIALHPKELVMGLEINGDARAYPVGMMRVREIVNDEVGGTPVLVTW